MGHQQMQPDAWCLNYGRYVRPSVIIRNVPALGEGYVTHSQPAKRKFALIFDNVKYGKYTIWTVSLSLY